MTYGNSRSGRIMGSKYCIICQGGYKIEEAVTYHGQKRCPNCVARLIQREEAARKQRMERKIEPTKTPILTGMDALASSHKKVQVRRRIEEILEDMMHDDYY